MALGSYLYFGITWKVGFSNNYSNKKEKKNEDKNQFCRNLEPKTCKFVFINACQGIQFSELMNNNDWLCDGLWRTYMEVNVVSTLKQPLGFNVVNFYFSYKLFFE